MKGFFVAGTDAGVGKSVVSAALVHRLRRSAAVLYWKPARDRFRPVHEGDAATVEDLAAAATLPSAEPFTNSQHVLETLREQPSEQRVIIEGPSGVLAPLSERELAADLMWWLRLPVVLVARDRVGEINRVLLSLEAMKARGIGVIGVVLRGAASADDIAAIERYGHVAMLGLMPELEPLDAESLREWSISELDPRGIIEGFAR